MNIGPRRPKNADVIPTLKIAQYARPDEPAYHTRAAQASATSHRSVLIEPVIEIHRGQAEIPSLSISYSSIFDPTSLPPGLDIFKRAIITSTMMKNFVEQVFVAYDEHQDSDA